MSLGTTTYSPHYLIEEESILTEKINTLEEENNKLKAALKQLWIDYSKLDNLMVCLSGKNYRMHSAETDFWWSKEKEKEIMELIGEKDDRS